MTYHESKENYEKNKDKMDKSDWNYVPLMFVEIILVFIVLREPSSLVATCSVNIVHPFLSTYVPCHMSNLYIFFHFDLCFTIFF